MISAPPWEKHLYRRVEARVGGKMTTMTVFEAMVMSLIAAGGRGNLKVIQTILDAISKPQTLAESMGGRRVFEFTKEEAARFTKEKFLKGMDASSLDGESIL